MNSHRDASLFPSLSLRQLKAVRALQQKKYRRETGTALIEGVRLCEEAVAGKVGVQAVIVTSEALEQKRVRDLLSVCASQKLPVFTVAREKYLSISDEPSPAGLAMVIETRPAAAWRGDEPLILAIDGLRDPGNLGTLLRSAAWFGVERVWLGGGCVELYNPKVLRGAMGASFRLAVEEEVDLVRRFAEAAEKGYRLWAAVPTGGEEPAHLQPTGRDVLLIGSEAHGSSAELMRAVQGRFTIPRKGYGESLNAAVAASIALYCFTQKR